MTISILSLERFKRENGRRHLKDVVRHQRTIASSVMVEGFGFWTGQDIRVEFRPAAVNTGFVFVRTDIPDEPRIPASVEFRDSHKPRQTSLVCGEARVDMVEHLLAALRGLQIDNCEIRVSAAEIPGMNGSSVPFMLAIDCGTRIVPQSEIQPVRMVINSTRITGGESSWIEVSPSRSGAMTLAYHLQYPSDNPIPEQSYRGDFDPQIFKRELASCRTFLTHTEAQQLLKQGLGKRVSAHDLLVFDEAGPRENHLHFENECARHKVVDLIGDFALANCDWIGTFEAHRSGHALNAACVEQLLTSTLLLDKNSLPKYENLVIEEPKKRAA